MSIPPTRRRNGFIVAFLAALLAFASAGVFAAFTSSDNASQNVSTGTVFIRITNDANSGHITDSWSNRAAGDTITRTFTVTNTSTLAISVLSLTITAPSTDLLISDPEGLHVQIYTCSQEYTTNTCGGTETVRQGDTTIAAANGVPFSIKDAGDLAPATNVFVKAIVSLPYAAANNLQDKSTTITYTVNATQREALDAVPSNTPQGGAPAAPDSSGVTVTPDGSGDVSVGFTAPSDGGSSIDNYQVTAHSTPTYFYGTSSPIQVNGLANGAHTLTISAHNAHGWSAESSTVSFTVSGAPAPPTITGTTPGDGAITVAFTPPTYVGTSPVTGYTVSCDPGAVSASGSSSPITVSGLTNGTAYTCTATATNSSGNSSASAASATTTPGGGIVPNSPYILSTASAHGQVTVSFFDTGVPTGGDPILDDTLQAFLGSTPEGDAAVVGGSPLTITGLTDGTTYTFKLVSSNDIGDSVPSVVLGTAGSGTPDPVDPNTVTESTTATSFNWGWAPVAGATHYILTQEDATVTNGAVATSNFHIVYDGTTPAFDATGLTTYSDYHFVVYAANAVGVSTPTDLGTDLPRPLPTAPTISDTSSFNNGIGVDWPGDTFRSDGALASVGGSTDAFGIQVYVNGVLVGGPDRWHDNTAGYFIGGLSRNTTYDIQIAGINYTGEGPKSPDLYVTTTNTFNG